MALPAFNMHELIEAGVHFGHKTKRWNPRMAPYIYGVRNDIHIIDLGKTVPLLHQALSAVRDTVARNGRILFVGTKRQAQDPIAEAAKRSGQYYINQRWLGGLLTNWHTIQASIKRLRKLDEQLSGPNIGFTKKELLSMQRQKEKLEGSLGGIKDMGGLPDMLFIIDTGKEDLAVKEAQKLEIPIVAIIDSNCTTDGITYPIPGNDDSTRAIHLYCRLISDAVIDGIQQSMTATGQDLGAREDVTEVLAMEGAQPAEADSAEAKAKEAKEEEAGRNKGSRNNRRGTGAAKKPPTVQVKKTPGKKA
ncbi:MAG: 30S ribosomal protein S2 [Pseudomonadota bacterium]|nr:30S ribosomal protein S2 [Pseudomonadota bacterium]